MAPHRRLWIAPLAALGLAAQEATYFQEERAPWWRPKGELRVQQDQLREDGYPDEGLDRTGARLLLRWAPSWSWGRLVLGTRHQVGSDGNVFNRQRYDNEPSNGSRVDLAYLAATAQGAHGFLEVRAGLQDSPLISQESLWDHDLSVAGGSLRAALRSEAWGVEEAGVRVLSGRVRTFPGAAVDLSAGQVVLRGETGPVAWTLHGGRWDLHWTGGEHRFRPLAGSLPGARQHMAFQVEGAGVKFQWELPVEAKWLHQRNVDTRQNGEELQVFVGSRTRTWWPQAGYVWQRYEGTGTPYPVNGDDWWFVANAKGPRWMLALPLTRRLLLQLSTLRHHWRGEAVTRTQVSLTWRFGA